MSINGCQWIYLTTIAKVWYSLFNMITEANTDNTRETVEFLTVQEVGDYLGISESTVYRYMNRYKKPLPAMRVSAKKILVKREDLENWLEEARKVAY